MFKKIYTAFLAGLLLTGCTIDNKKDVTTETTKLPVVESEEVIENEEKETKEIFRYLSKDYFYTDFEGESVVQTDTEYANTICQRNLDGKLTDSYYMGENFIGIFYIDEEWLYYTEFEKDEYIYRVPLDEEDYPDGIFYIDGDWRCYTRREGGESLYRVPFSHKDGKEYPEFSKKEFLFTEPDGFSYSDFTEDSFLQIVDNTIYYCTGSGLGTYNLESREHKYYPVPDNASMFVAGTHYMAAEGPKQCDILVNLETGKSKVIKTDAHPWLRLGKECYLPFPYTMSGNILLDLNSGETMEVISQEEEKQIAKEIGMPSDNEYERIKYIGYYNHRVYAETKYTVTLTDKNGREVKIEDTVCVSRNMDEEKSWTIEKEITAHSRKKILEFYKKVKSGKYKAKKNSAYYDEEFDIGEGITNGIFYFSGYYNKDGKMAIDIYDLDKKEFRVIGRNSPETFYPFYGNSHKMMYGFKDWTNIRCTAPILGQGEDLWEQKQKRSGKYWDY